MRARILLTAAAGVCVFFGGLRPGGRSYLAAQTNDEGFPETPGRDVFQAVCSACHMPTRVQDKQWTRAQWKDKVLEMLQEEPDVSDMEREQIVEYLSRNFSKKVNVNKATAGEIAATLEIPAEDAAAIVAYREAQGGFKSLDDLKKVPGLDARAVESNKRRVEF
ncbi:MAG TPA: helix-hairpin-helix domain-containing protein [Bryobacteraceae bacterium]|nr:helix-hairpin-helix domain-containing protein [Bryobacteraceae bacterium]